MYSKAATAAAILAFIAVTEAKMDASQVKKMVEKDAARVQARKAKTFDGKMFKGVRLGKEIETSPTYVTISLYGTTDCSNSHPYLATIYGTNMCLPITATGITASSTQYTWDSTNSILNEVYYSDSACTTAVAMDQVYDFSGTAVNTCTLGYEYSTSSSYSFPASGYASQLFTSSSTCSSNTPYMAAWFTSSADDDVIAFDDDTAFVALSCTASATSGFAFLDDDNHDDLDSVSYSASVYVSTSSGTSSGSSSNSCFAGSESVMLADGSTKAISEVVVGDSILSADANGNAKFSNVIAVPHDRNNELATFTQISTAAGDIKMTSEHLVMVDEACNGSNALKTASSVEAGMCLVSTSGSQSVESVKTVQGHGIYSVVTEEEFVVVNGFVASPFAVNHAVANAYYNVIRAVPSLMNFDVVKQASMMFGSLAESMSA